MHACSRKIGRAPTPTACKAALPVLLDAHSPLIPPHSGNLQFVPGPPRGGSSPAAIGWPSTSPITFFKGSRGGGRTRCRVSCVSVRRANTGSLSAALSIAPAPPSVLDLGGCAPAPAGPQLHRQDRLTAIFPVQRCHGSAQVAARAWCCRRAGGGGDGGASCCGGPAARAGRTAPKAAGGRAG
eukprot:SAG22_NODE_177_length_16160_cov_41.299296_1_plen_182_part_10